MLLLSQLRAFVDNYIAERDNIENNIVVASDDEAGKLYKDTVNANNLCSLIVVIPSHNSDSNNEDNAQFKNNLTFLFVKKTNDKGGNELRLTNFELCQLEVLALAEKIKTLIERQGENCTFRNLDINSISVLPIANYFNANGYVMSFNNKTDF